ncbi:hypothetical protein PCASD_20100 [Puccinia coronata f. sp. avenae]|uniref:Integrase catalytic domain-containing protein n=1 Tax=Puccinia coronata f. sp. avenae TaxID=200324 RepID=A0A2N5U5D5_9BASI|nr:hypothetical protein PCASD_20100 [Puccinia coronata f. sp. avenae]
MVVDNYSGYLAGFPLVKKDDTTDVLINLLENEEKHLGYSLTLICSDGGGKFTGSRLSGKRKPHNCRINESYLQKFTCAKKLLARGCQVILLCPQSNPKVRSRTVALEHCPRSRHPSKLPQTRRNSSSNAQDETGSVINTKHVRFLKPSADQIPEADKDFYPELKTIDEN